MSSTNKSYNEIVSTCLLADYKQELAGKFAIWAEYWVDESLRYKAIFTETQTSPLPHTIFADNLDD